MNSEITIHDAKTGETVTRRMTDEELSAQELGFAAANSIRTDSVPVSVSRFQARAALHVAGLLDAVEAAVAAAPDPLVQIAWADAQSFERSSPTIATLAAAIGLSDTQVDDLFIAAAKIRA